MADEEQFSLCWNNFNSNLSAGFHESLCRGDLVDVTLAAEGHLVKAHRLVLSVCSPYFRKMFTQMPANQHAFVFLKDVSHAALKDLIQFMYCGEVNVKQDALPTFISTAEALQIKGLTETGDAATTPASAQSPAKVPTPAPSTTSTTATTTSPRTRGIQRNVSRTSYKIDSEDSSDDRPIIPAATTTTQQKRLIQRSLTPVSSVPAIKRIKTTADPLEESDDHQQSQQLQHQTQQLVDPEGKDETEFIDLPIESLPTKAEPDYGEEDAGEVEAVEQDVNYVEDDSYGDMKYDESYFTENEDAKAGASGFADQSYAESGGGDQSANEAQETTSSKVYTCIIKQHKMKGKKLEHKANKEKLISSSGIIYEMSQRGNKLLHYEGHKYIKNNVYGKNIYWKCTKWHGGCKARAITNIYNGNVCSTRNVHNHQYVFDTVEPVEIIKDEDSIKSLKEEYFDF